MKKIPITHEDEIHKLIETTAKVSGIDKMDILNKSRKQNINLARMVACNIARVDKKIHYTTIARVVNRTRSNIYHYERKHKIYYETWPIYRNLFTQVYNAYTNKKFLYLSKDMFLKELKKHNIFDVKQIQVRIYITAKNFKHTISSDYKTFTETIEKLKFILADYEHQINIEV
tara:strand:+ start:212 stop:730 length:519 start_codon:yes stop_codon:yes gene_type:complete